MSHITCETAVFTIQFKVLEVFCEHVTEGYCLNYSGLKNHIDIDRQFLRAACLTLRDMGFLTYERGLWGEDGEPARAGYAITLKGRDFYNVHKCVDKLEAAE